MLTEVAGFRIAMSVERVRTVLPKVDLRPSVLQGPLCHGITEHGEWLVPVADPLALIGLGAVPKADVTQGIVLMTARGLVAVALSGVHQIVRLSDSELRPLPPFGVARPEFFKGVWPAADGHHYLVLDVDHLVADPEVDAMGALNTRVSSGVEETSDVTEDPGVRRAGASYLHYSIGIDVVTPLAQIAEIIPFPTDLITSNEHHDEILGLLVHRDVVVPLVSLPGLLGRPDDEGEREAGVVIMLSRGDGLVGVAVPALRAIAPSRWEAVDDGAWVDAPFEQVLETAPLVRMGLGEESRLVPRLDLHQLVDRLRPTVPTLDALAFRPTASAA